MSLHPLALNRFTTRWHPQSGDFIAPAYIFWTKRNYELSVWFSESRL